MSHSAAGRRRPSALDSDFSTDSDDDVPVAELQRRRAAAAAAAKPAAAAPPPRPAAVKPVRDEDDAVIVIDDSDDDDAAPPPKPLASAAATTVSGVKRKQEPAVRQPRAGGRQQRRGNATASDAESADEEACLSDSSNDGGGARRRQQPQQRSGSRTSALLAAAGSSRQCGMRSVTRKPPVTRDRSLSSATSTSSSSSSSSSTSSDSGFDSWDSGSDDGDRHSRPKRQPAAPAARGKPASAPAAKAAGDVPASAGGRSMLTFVRSGPAPGSLPVSRAASTGSAASGSGGGGRKPPAASSKAAAGQARPTLSLPSLFRSASSASAVSAVSTSSLSSLSSAAAAAARGGSRSTAGAGRGGETEESPATAVVIAAASLSSSPLHQHQHQPPLSWIDKHAPTSEAHLLLALHKKKVAEVRDWIVRARAAAVAASAATAESAAAAERARRQALQRQLAAASTSAASASASDGLSLPPGVFLDEFGNPVDADGNAVLLDGDDLEGLLASVSDGAGGSGSGWGAAPAEAPPVAPAGPPPRLLILHGPPGTGKSTAVRVLAAELGLALREWTDNGPRGGAAAAGSGGQSFAPGVSGGRGNRFAKRGAGAQHRGGRYSDGDDDGAGVASVVAGLYHARLHDDETAGASSFSSAGPGGSFASGQSVPYASVLTLFRDFMGRSALYKTLTLAPAISGGGVVGIAAAPRTALSIVASGGRKSGTGAPIGGSNAHPPATSTSASTSANGSDSGHLLLLEDLPRTHGGSYSGGLDRDSKEEIQAIFSAFLATGATSSTAAGSSTGGGGSLLPCVLVLSEGDGPGEAASRHAITRMLGTGIVDHPSTTVIELPPVPDTRMRKVLESALDAEVRQARRQAADADKALAATNNGAVPRAMGGADDRKAASGGAPAAKRRRVDVPAAAAASIRPEPPTGDDACADSALTVAAHQSAAARRRLDHLTAISSGAQHAAVIDGIIATARGDLRHALLSLEYATVVNAPLALAATTGPGGARGTAVSSGAGGGTAKRRGKVAKGLGRNIAADAGDDGIAHALGGGTLSRRSSTGEEGFDDTSVAGATAAAAILCGRDDFLDALHSLGKLLNGKRLLPVAGTPLPSHLSNGPDGFFDWTDGDSAHSAPPPSLAAVPSGGGPLSYDPDSVLLGCPYDVATAGDFIHENCPPYFTDIGQLSAALDVLGDADMLWTHGTTTGSGIGGGGWRGGNGGGGNGAAAGSSYPRVVVAALVSRAVSTHNQTPAPKTFRPVHRPAAYAVRRAAASNTAKWISEGCLGALPDTSMACFDALRAPPSSEAASAAGLAPAVARQRMQSTAVPALAASLVPVSTALGLRLPASASVTRQAAAPAPMRPGGSAGSSATRSSGEAATPLGASSPLTIASGCVDHRQRILGSIPAYGLMLRCLVDRQLAAGGSGGGRGGTRPTFAACLCAAAAQVGLTPRAAAIAWAACDFGGYSVGGGGAAGSTKTLVGVDARAAARQLAQQRQYAGGSGGGAAAYGGGGGGFAGAGAAAPAAGGPHDAQPDIALDDDEEEGEGEDGEAGGAKGVVPPPAAGSALVSQSSAALASLRSMTWGHWEAFPALHGIDAMTGAVAGGVAQTTARGVGGGVPAGVPVAATGATRPNSVAAAAAPRAADDEDAIDDF